MMSILTDLKVSSLECKWISYRSEHWRIELTFQDLKIKKWNIPANGPQRVDEKNGVIWLTIMFNPRVAVTKMLKMANFLYFQQFLSDIFPIQTFFAKSDIPKKKFHLIVEEYDGETLPHDETKNIRKLLKGGDLISLNIVILAQLLLIKRKQFLKLCLE